MAPFGISLSPTVVAGDFNNHVRWDRPGGTHNHGANVDRLASQDLVSAYHEYHGIGQGDERHPTIYWMWSAPGVKDYHIDYCFVPRLWLPALRSVTVGSQADHVATHASDHVPLVVDLAIDELLSECAQKDSNHVPAGLGVTPKG